MPKRTYGYIVVGQTGEPLTWSDGISRFITSLYSQNVRWKTTMFDDYETARKCIGWHYHTIFNDAREFPESYHKFQGLRIVSLNAAEVAA